MKKRQLIAPGALAALVLSACGGGGGGTGSGDIDVVEDGTLVIGIHEDPGNLFRSLNNSATLSQVFPIAYEAPVWFDEDGEAQPWLAESWEDTPTEVEWTIREGVQCPDGSELDAELVADNYRWILDPDNGSTAIGTVIPPDAEIDHDNDARTVTVTTETPNSFLMAQIGIHPIACREALEDPDSVAAGTDGTGLFELVEAVPGDHYTFERKDDYDWPREGAPDGQTAGVPQTVEYRIVENPSTRANMLLAGDLNIASVQGPDEDRVAETVDVLMEQDRINAGIAYSQAEGMPGEEEEVRIALTKALDIEALMQVNTSGNGEIPTRLATLEPEICQYDAVGPNTPSYDPDEAEAMLDEAGWTREGDGIRTRDGEELVLDFAWTTRWPENSATAEMMADMWEEIGVGVNHDGGDHGAWTENVFSEGSTEHYEVMWIGLNHFMPGALGAYVSGDLPPSGNNFAAIENEDFAAALAEAEDLSGADACDAWEQAEAALYSSGDMVQIAMQPDATYSQGVEGTIAPGWPTIAALLLTAD
ncbi:ABC transporter substrate-binding protein [Nesterenkonia sp. MY13]|uniref:ABC transporter substrate-binding protein n=1 Tax=Nesterenkonia sedimenti TaxID=1463632 RepID=A0A7X8YEB6_9MICC|nr:ABC transporter substrate-binding protein [Nesterenkonia sedimenti]NLS10464.1 ABC transporter substrate-binding protein [Nesterenkonia sedimenti]